MDYYFEVSKIIENGLKGDKLKVGDYALNLSKKLKNGGDHQAGIGLGKLLKDSESSGGKKHVIIAQNKKNFKGQSARPIPVEKESRFSLADKVSYEDGSVKMFLSNEQSEQINLFIKNIYMRDELMAFGLPVNPSLLLHGVPGTGKSKMASYIASKLKLPLVTARSDALISSYLGSTAKNIRSLLEYAQSEPCVLFLDEFDALAKARDDKNEIGELKRVVVSLLQNIDNLGETVLIAATNHSHLLDPAIWRRFHYKMELLKPAYSERVGMIESLTTLFYLRGTDIKLLSRFSDGLTGAEIEMSIHAYFRTIVIDGNKFEPYGLIRVFLAHKYSQFSYHQPGRNESLIKLRQEDSELYSHSVLGKIFNMSPSNVGKILKGSG